MDDNKKKYAYWMKPSMVAEIEASLDLANVKSKGEFVCQAVDFYLGYLNHKKTVKEKAEISRFRALKTA